MSLSQIVAASLSYEACKTSAWKFATSSPSSPSKFAPRNDEVTFVPLCPRSGLRASPRQNSNTRGRHLNHKNQPTSVSSCDAELIKRAQKGEEQAFEAIFHAYKRKIYYLCLRMIGNSAEAEELTQEAFMRVFRKLHTFRGESSFATWLHRVSINVVLMRLRKKRPNEIPIESSEDAEKSERPPKEFGAPDLKLT